MVRDRGIVVKRLILVLFVICFLVLCTSLASASSLTITYSPTAIYAGEEVTFTANVEGVPESDITSYEWDFGSGFTLFGKTVTYQFPKGNYTVVLTVKYNSDDSGSNADKYAIWANSTTANNVFKLSSSSNIVNGKIHSNNDVEITGSNNTINSSVEYVSEYSGPENIKIVKSTPLPYPVQYEISDYRPDGVKVPLKMYKYVNGSLSIGSDAVLDGLYYVTGDASLGGNNITGTCTIVAEGDISISGNKHNITHACSGNLLFFSNGTLLKISSSESFFGGSMFIPNGTLHISGSKNNLNGAMLGDTVMCSAQGLGTFGLNFVSTSVPVNVEENVDVAGSVSLEPINSSYIGELVPIEARFLVTENVMAVLTVDGYEIWRWNLLHPIESTIWVPMASGSHTVSVHLYTLTGLECDSASRKAMVYIRRVR